MAGQTRPGELTLADVQTGAANYMLGHLQMTIAGGQSITPAKWQQAIEDTVAFQRRMADNAGAASTGA
ncbi:hypothetical protein ACIQCM_05465 [Pseudarthrobacter sp. NPDC092439]|uniref:hypothetical protein n=1 Tax=unclassified Pseudarthrobacter TaxID=2647000 RepID=UPI00381D0028